MEKDEKKNIHFEISEKGSRLDLFLCQKIGLTRSRIQQLIQTKNILLNNKDTKPAAKLKTGDRISVQIIEPESLNFQAEKLPLDILFEDEDILLVNKEAHIVVHPCAGHSSGTLVNALLHHCKTLSSSSEEGRPGIIHRLDKGTSGVLLVAKNDLAGQKLQAQFKDRSIKKVYKALAWGIFKKQTDTIDKPLGRAFHDRKRMSTVTRKGREAKTEYHLLQQWGPIAYLEIFPSTGRTHQIRVHLKSIGHPIVSDPQYGKKKTTYQNFPNKVAQLINASPYQYLHAYSLTFSHPRTHEILKITAPIREDMTLLLQTLKEHYEGPSH